MNTNNRLTFISSLLSLLTFSIGGCDSESTSDTAVFRDAGYVDSWNSIKCMNGTASRCFAHSAIGGDTVTPVVSWCDIHSRVQLGELAPTTDGWLDSCDPGGRPEQFDDAMCFYDSLTHVVCYGGSGGWYTEVTPTCAPNEFTQAAWPTGTCDLDGSPGNHSYDAVLTVPMGLPWGARAVLIGDAFNAVPQCMTTAGVNGESPYSCMWDDEFPCCSCDAENILTCVTENEYGKCPAGTAYEVYECA
jgi:hypothetical protein